ncbi:MAG TPA: hypothetical protein VFM25_04675 [Verrucomicrobiae bacterium]|nr:hypothetical protein [Verrucomicrobiae bacterium]
MNAIIPTDAANLKLPPLFVKNVTAPELFIALEAASRKTEDYMTSYFQTAYGFKTENRPDENSIWYFFVQKPPTPPKPAKMCRFYELAPYLDAGYKVDDITTAVETAWKMLGETNTPNISYHKDTRLLIAVGEEGQLNLIQEALGHLAIPKDKPANESNAEKPKAK